MEHLSDSEKMIKLITMLSDKDEAEVKQWTPMALKQVYAKVLDAISDIDPAFYPVFELDGVRYGFSSISKLTLGEYVDLERLAKQPQENIEEIMAILYRPIVKDRFKGLKWAFKNTYKVGLGDAENLFKYYTLEEYDSNKRLDNAEKLNVLPATMALGALTFFLTLANTSLIGSNLSSLSPKQQMIAMKEITNKMTSMNIGAGLQQFIISQTLPSFKSQEMIASLN